MQIYDTHADIFSNLYERNLEGVKDPFLKYHQKNLQAGEIKGGIWVMYSESDFDIVPAYRKALELFAPYKNQYDVLPGLEGLRNVPNLEVFDQLYQMGIRHASLTWNEENHLATGVKGPKDHGLKPHGKTFLNYMNSHKMIIDVSHLNIKSFYDVLEHGAKILIASHSNSYTLCPHPRNLNDEQLEALRKAGGKVGAVGARSFVSQDPSKQNIAGFVDQISYLVDKMGIDNVMLGLDMMDYLKGFEGSNLDDLVTHADAQGIVRELEKRKFSQLDIEKICYRNFLSVKERVGKI